MNETPVLSIITVNYRSKDVFEVCLRSFVSFLAKENISFEWIVVNNDSKENFSTPKSYVSVYTLKENVGFGSACNYGVQKAQGDVIWFLNPDTEYVSGNLKKSMNLLQNKGIVGHRIINKEQKTIPWTYGRYLTFWRLISQNIFPKKQFLFCEGQDVCEVDWVSGASFIIRKKDFLLGKGFDSRFFMYFEDMDLCRSLKEDLGVSVYRDASLSLYHASGKSFHSCTKEQKVLYYTSMEMYIKKYFSVWQRLCTLPLLQAMLSKKRR